MIAIRADSEDDARPGLDDAGARPRVLIADDQQDMRRALCLLLEDEGFTTKEAASPESVLATVRAGERLSAVLLDMNYARDTTSGREGLDLLAQLTELAPELPLVVMTAWGSVDLAVEAMRAGARDFLQKPWENERLLAVVRTQCDLAQALRRGSRLQRANRLLQADASVAFIAESKPMQEVIATLERVAASDAAVLLTGEHGSGKTLASRLLHERSGRAEEPFVTLNAGALPECEIDAELFGLARSSSAGAGEDRPGRFEVADGGTLVLDEIANVPASMQPKLLSVLERAELERVGSNRTVRVDVRLVSTTNADMSLETREGRFREDLLYRLNTIEIALPPLRQRGGDIVLLARAALSEISRRHGRELIGFAPSAEKRLCEHAWPGNVRELRHAVERAVLLCRGRLIEAADLELGGRSGSTAALEHMTLDEAERELLKRALERQGGNVKAAAADLGLSRSGMYRRLERHGLQDGRGSGS